MQPCKVLLRFVLSVIFLTLHAIPSSRGGAEGYSRLAAEFIIYFIPSLFLQIVYNILLRYLACQSIVKPSAIAAALATAINIAFCYVTTFQLHLGIIAGAFSVTLAYLTICMFLLIYICIKLRPSKTWQGWSWECFDEWVPYMSLAIPSLVMVALEWCCFEIGILLLGMVSELYQATQTILYNLAGLSYFLFFGLSLAASVRVGNFLGSGKIPEARRAVRVSLGITIISATCIGMLFIILKDVLGYLFTSNKAVLELTSKSIFIVGIAEIFDCTQIVLMGLVRGFGIQKFGAIINACGNLLIGTPSYCLLIFLAKLGVVGFWTGVLIGYLFSGTVYFIVTIKSDLEKLSVTARERSGILQNSVNFSVSEDQIRFENENSIQNKRVNFTEDMEDADDVTALVSNEEQLPRGLLVGNSIKFSTPEVTDTEGTKFLKSKDPQKKSFILIKIILILLSVSTLIIGIFIKLFI